MLRSSFEKKKNKVNVHTERPCKQDHFVLYIQDTGFIQKKKDPHFYLSFRYFCENLISSTSISTSRLWQFFFLPKLVCKLQKRLQEMERGTS